MTGNNSNQTNDFLPCENLPFMDPSERPITVDEACALKLLLFGNMEDSFGNAWTDQSFTFRSVPPYGFLQKKPGPCGVLAAVQGYVLYELFYGDPPVISTSELKRMKSAEKVEALSRALAAILWQAGDKQSAIVCNSSPTPYFNAVVKDSFSDFLVVTDNFLLRFYYHQIVFPFVMYGRKYQKLLFRKEDIFALNTDEAAAILKQDGIIEYVHLVHFQCKSCLIEYLSEISSEIMKDGNASCILLLYSVILSRGIEKIKKEMDDPGSRLIGEDGYCSQEVVNLLLTGKAVANLFDGDLELNSGGSETTLHHGIHEKSNIGLLSLYDYHEFSPVGRNYKDPANPIWILAAVNHFTVLFAKERNCFENNNGSFMLYHYDGLAKQRAETAYIIKPNDKLSSSPKDKDLPVAVRCIYTRWPLASIEEKGKLEDKM